MLAPLSWLNEYIKISQKPDHLGDRLTEIGLGTENIKKTDDDVIFEFEITPNRPDLLSIIGIAREIAAIEGKKITLPNVTTNLKPKKGTRLLPLSIRTNYAINPRFTSIIISNVLVKESPQWLKERLEKIGQRPINNIVDITNYVMFELGNPLHAFDYDKIEGHAMIVDQAKAGEEFTSVDGIIYRLPNDAVILRDSEKIIDLCGIKGGKNTGTYSDTKTIVLRAPIEDSVLIRKASQSLSLRSDASSIFERGVDKGGTILAMKRAVDLIQELAGGEISSELFDLKRADFLPKKLTLRLSRLEQILGISIPKETVIRIFESLTLTPKLIENRVDVTIPTYRNDLLLEEDLIEEVARLYGYNKFPKTLPVGAVPKTLPPYYKDYRFDEQIKRYFQGNGFTEIQTYSLISEEDVKQAGFKPIESLRVDNPVSKDFEYLRPSLKRNLLKALQHNKTYEKIINLFELGKVYRGKSIDKKEEFYQLAGVTNAKSYATIKGIFERLFSDHDTQDFPYAISQEKDALYFEMNYSLFLEKQKKTIVFKPIPKFPPLLEDMAFIVPSNVKLGSVLETIQKQSAFISDVSILDEYDDTKTFHIVYLSHERNLTSEDIKTARQKIILTLQEKFAIHFKE